MSGWKRIGIITSVVGEEEVTINRRVRYAIVLVFAAALSVYAKDKTPPPVYVYDHVGHVSFQSAPPPTYQVRTDDQTISCYSDDISTDCSSHAGGGVFIFTFDDGTRHLIVNAGDALSSTSPPKGISVFDMPSDDPLLASYTNPQLDPTTGSWTPGKGSPIRYRIAHHVISGSFLVADAYCIPWQVTIKKRSFTFDLCYKDSPMEDSTRTIDQVETDMARGKP
jgi:hypothetical protein